MFKSDFSLHERTIETMMTYDFRTNLSFDVPMLFVFGEEDYNCPPELLKECFDNISAPEKKMEIIPKAAHSCFYDKPQAFMGVITAFVEALSN